MHQDIHHGIAAAGFVVAHLHGWKRAPVRPYLSVNQVMLFYMCCFICAVACVWVVGCTQKKEKKKKEKKKERENVQNSCFEPLFVPIVSTHAGHAQLPDSMQPRGWLRVCTGSLHVFVVWAVVQSAIIAECVSRAEDAQLDLVAIDNIATEFGMCKGNLVVQREFGGA